MSQETLDNHLKDSHSILAQVNPQTLHSAISRFPYRASLMLLPSSEVSSALKCTIRSLRSFGTHFPYPVPAPDSEEESEEEAQPSVPNIAQQIIDEDLVSLADFPDPNCQHRPALAITPLDSKFKTWNIYGLLNKGLVRTVKFNYQGQKSLGLFFESLDQAKEAYKHLVEETEKGKLASSLYRISGVQSKLQVKWLVNRCLEKTQDWNGIIVKGIPKNITKEFFQNKLREMATKVTEPVYINSVRCCLIVLRSIEDAYALLKNFHKLKINAEIHMHPLSSIFKNPGEHTRFVVHGERSVKRKRASSESELTKHPKLKENPPEELTTTAESTEEGEVGPDEFYDLTEYPGKYISKDGEILEHSGVLIRTSHAMNDLSNV